jgi:hypothetical protein
MHFVESFHGIAVRQSMQQSSTMTDLDKVVRRVYGYTSDHHMYQEFSGLQRVCQSRMEASCDDADDHLHTPMLLLQPDDDPLHQVSRF